MLLNITPGPDVLYIVGHSVSQGRLGGVVSAFGIGAGSLFHVAAATFGRSALLLALPLAYDAVRVAGAADLVWMGVRVIRSRSSVLAVAAMTPTPLGVIFRQGLLTNALNPKVALFFLAFLPQFTDAARGPLAPQFLLLGGVFIVNGLLVCLAYAVAASWVGSWLMARYDVQTWLNRAMGLLFIGLGLRLALGGRR